MCEGIILGYALHSILQSIIEDPCYDDEGTSAKLHDASNRFCTTSSAFRLLLC